MNDAIGPFGLRHMRYFLAVAEAGSFRGAAEKLHVAQSAVSRRIQELEAALTAPLFDRTAKGVALSPAGEMFQPRARRIAADLDSIRASLKDGAAASACKLAFPPLVPQLGFFPGLVSRFRARHPGIRLDLMQAAAPIDDLLDGAADAVLTHAPPVKPRGVEAMTLQAGVYVLALTAQHRLAHEDALACADLQDVFVFPRAFDPEAFDALSERLAPGATLHEVASEDTRLALAGAGMGVSLASSFAFKETSDLLMRPLRDLQRPSRLALVLRRGDLGFAAQRFRETAADFFA